MKTSNNTSTRWMVVDDEEENAWLLQHMLSLIGGVEVACFSCPQEALATFNQDPQGFNLVITDFNMPGMTGDELRRQLRAIAPRIKIVLMTGNLEWTQTDSLLRGFNGFLQKPFSISELRDLALSLTGNLRLQAA